MIFTDSHAHLSSVAQGLGTAEFSSLLSDYAQAEEVSAREGRERPILVDIGTESDDLPGRIALLATASGELPSFLRLSTGIWPSAENLASPQASLAALRAAIEVAAARGFRVSAIGEGGLDFHHDEGSHEAQAELFEGQLALAAELGLPMIVHSRDAAADTLDIVARTISGSRAKVLIHCFGYGPEEARAFLDLGCWISFAGNLTYKGSEALREACVLVPEERLLLETDAPYMNPMPGRGKSSSPLDVERTYAFAAELWGLKVAALAETVSRNAHILFG